MAILTNRTFLMKGTTSQSSTTFTKLIDIIEDPDMGGAPDQIDITTLSSMQYMYMNGIQSADAKTFTAWYTKTDYEALKALEGEKHTYAVWYGGSDEDTPTGADGKFSWEGQLSVYVNGGGNNEARKMTITISTESEVTEDS